MDILYYVINVLMYVFAVLAFMHLSMMINLITSGQFNILALIYILVFGGLAALIYFRKDFLRMEYEYTLTNGDLDFARVFNNSRRKNLGSMKIKNVEVMGYVTNEKFPRYNTMKPLTRDNWFLNKEANLFFFFFNKEGTKRMIVIEPSAEMVELIKKSAARGAFLQ